ncbi:unnamed protein product, partial [marine sediment metagenome]
AMLARELQMRKVIVPRAPGQFSAWGMLMTDLRHDYIRTHVIPCEREHLREIRDGFLGLEQVAMAQFEAEFFPSERVSIDRFLDLRYKGQEHTVRTPVTASNLNDGGLDTVLEMFHRLHDQAYAFRQDDPVEIVNFHVVGWGAVGHPSVTIQETNGRSLSSAGKGKRSVVFEDVGAVPSRVFERDLLPVGEQVVGPVIVEEPACTTIVCPNQQLLVDEYGNLVVTEVG